MCTAARWVCDVAERVVSAWAIAHVSNNLTDGYRRWLEGVADHPSQTQLFKTRAEARAFIQKYAYIRKRPDLRKQPHGWRMPQPVKVTVTVREFPR